MQGERYYFRRGRSRPSPEVQAFTSMFFQPYLQIVQAAEKKQLTPISLDEPTSSHGYHADILSTGRLQAQMGVTSTPPSLITKEINEAWFCMVHLGVVRVTDGQHGM